MIAEAASKDRVWGIGFTEKNAMANRADWGENRLGKALVAAREHLRNEDVLGEQKQEEVGDPPKGDQIEE